MMLAVLLLAAQAPMAQATPPQTAVEAEAAFAEDAQRRGQWTAFREWAAPDAVLFAPTPRPVEEVLAELPDPPQSVRWWPGQSLTSCDGAAAVNRGTSSWPDGGGGRFTTVWQRQPDGAWRWLIDHGDRTPAAQPRPAMVDVRRAACTGTPPAQSRGYPDGEGGGASADRTLRWFWRVAADGERWFTAELWMGYRYATVMTDHVAAPPPRSRAPADGAAR